MHHNTWKILIRRFHDKRWNLLATFAPGEMYDDSVKTCLDALRENYSEHVQFLTTDREDWDRCFNGTPSK